MSDPTPDIVIINHSLGGQYLESFDPEMHAPGKPYPTGFAVWTEDPGKAMRFPNKEAAFKYVRQIPKCCPTRPDGKPNRPLMAFTMEIAPL